MNSKDHADLVRQQFGRTAENYKTSASHAQGLSLSRLCELITPQPHWCVLDVATGAGHTAALFSPHVKQVIACDLTQAMLNQARKLSEERGLTNIEFRLEDAQQLSFTDGSFDLVSCRVAAHHFPRPELFIQECERILKAKGLIVLIDNVVPENKTSADWINDFERARDPSHQRCLSISVWNRLLTTRGLDIRHQEINHKYFDFNEWVQRMKVDAELSTQLGEKLLNAPRDVKQFLDPTCENGKIRFRLQEAILIGRKA